MKQENLIKYFDFRKEFLEEESKKTNENLTCVYCGREHLEIGYTDIENSHKNDFNSNLATVDHIIPRLPFDKKLNKKICVVACRKCNHNKSDIEPSMLEIPIYGNMKVDTYKIKHFGTKGTLSVKTGNSTLHNSVKKIKSSDNRKLLFRGTRIYRFFDTSLSLNLNFDLVQTIFDLNFNYYLYTKSKAFYFSNTFEFTKENCLYKLSTFWENETVIGDIKEGVYTLCKKEGDAYVKIKEFENTSHTLEEREIIKKHLDFCSNNYGKLPVREDKENQRVLMTNIHNKARNNDAYVLFTNGKKYKLDKYGSNEIVYFNELNEKEKIKYEAFAKIKKSLKLIDNNNVQIPHLI